MKASTRRRIGAWPRVVEVALAIWLATATWVVLGSISMVYLLHALLVSLAVASCSIVSMLHANHVRAHLLNLLFGAWLVAHAFLFAAMARPAMAQIELLTGLTVVMFAVVPSRALEPPATWRKYYENIE